METNYSVILPYELSATIIDQSLTAIIDQFNTFPTEEEEESEHEQ